MSELAKVLPDIIRLTEEANRSSAEASERLRQVLEELNEELALAAGEIEKSASLVMTGDEVLHYGQWRTVRCTSPCPGLASCVMLTFDEIGSVHYGKWGLVRCKAKPCCPSGCDRDTHRWPCAEAEAICEGLEWERGA